MAKFLNSILILILLVAGGRLAIRGQEYRVLSQERNQLVEKLDGFRVRDRSKYLVQMVESDDPMLFMWRIHVPGGFETQYLAKIGNEGGAYFAGSAFGSEGKLESASLRFEFVGESFFVDMQSLFNGHRSGCGGADLVRFCQQHWSDLEIEILGQGGPVEIDVDREVNFLSIKIPDELLGELEAKFGKDLARRFSKQSFCRFSFGERGIIERIRQESQGTWR